MSRIDSVEEATTGSASARADSRNGEMTREQLGIMVARAHRLRAEAIRAWTCQLLQTCASLWRRPGSAIPEGYRPAGRVAPAAGH